MYKIDSENNIYLTRGDTCVLKLAVTDSEEQPYDYSNDTVQLTVKASTYTETIIIQKNISGDSFIIDPSDTANLNYGKYLYDVQIITPLHNVYTVIAPANFIVCDEVNFNA